VAASPEPKPGVIHQLLLSFYWLAYNLQWAALLAIMLPSQVAAIAGPDRKELVIGIVTSVGALFSLVLTPVAGARSDRSRSRFGRRRPYIAWGTALNIVFLIAMATIGPRAGLIVFALAYVGVQLGSNWAGGPYAALIPDVVPESGRGAASGWMALMSTVGTLAGVLMAGQLVKPGHYLPAAAVIATVLAIAAVATCAGVREVPRIAPATAPDAAVGSPLRTFLPDPRAHRDFYWVLATRCLVGMGIYSVFSFFQYFLADVIGAARPEQQASYLIGIIIAAGIPTSLVAGAHSDRIGRKPLVYASGALMALASLAFVFAGYGRSLPWMFAVGAVFGIGYGAYQAVDWALAIDVLPPGGDAGRDMGIWHVALVLPQVLAPALSGLLLAAFKPVTPVIGYTVVFAVTAVWFVLGTVLVSRVRGAR
jgi:Na+/melibiose symporter-like transporter